jgi:anaphase-promoting complex subunit 5
LEKEESADMQAFARISALRISEPASNASAVDTDMLLGFAINQLQKLGTRVPDDVKSRLETWIADQTDSGTQSLHFFMAFFEHWRAGQYNMALESLHRYFDYSLTARTGGDNMRVFYQYALLHLSVLHADFECWDESVDAMNECIATGKHDLQVLHGQ